MIYKFDFHKKRSMLIKVILQINFWIILKTFCFFYKKRIQHFLNLSSIILAKIAKKHWKNNGSFFKFVINEVGSNFSNIFANSKKN